MSEVNSFGYLWWFQKRILSFTQLFSWSPAASFYFDVFWIWGINTWKYSMNKQDLPFQKKKKKRMIYLLRIYPKMVALLRSVLKVSQKIIFSRRIRFWWFFWFQTITAKIDYSVGKTSPLLCQKLPPFHKNPFDLDGCR